MFRESDAWVIKWFARSHALNFDGLFHHFPMALANGIGWVSIQNEVGYTAEVAACDWIGVVMQKSEKKLKER